MTDTTPEAAKLVPCPLCEGSAARFKIEDGEAASYIERLRADTSLHAAEDVARHHALVVAAGLAVQWEQTMTQNTKLTPLGRRNEP